MNEPQDDPVLLLAEAVLELIRTIRAQPAPVINVAAPVVTIQEREQPAPVVNVTTPDVTVTVPQQPAPVVNVTTPVESVVHIASLPPLNAKVKRDGQGRLDSITG